MQCICLGSTAALLHASVVFLLLLELQLLLLMILGLAEQAVARYDTYAVTLLCS